MSCQVHIAQTIASLRLFCDMPAPTDGQVSQETALAQQITKGQAREIMQKYMPVPETALQTHRSSLVSIAIKHKQMHIQVGSEPVLLFSLYSFVIR